MSCTDYGGVIICGPGEMERTRDEPDGDPRWCFKCRAICDFRFTFDRPVFDENNPYASIYVYPAIRCGTCGTGDGDCFPGWSREWEE